eukprot:gene1300-1642_t
MSQLESSAILIQRNGSFGTIVLYPTPCGRTRSSSKLSTFVINLTLADLLASIFILVSRSYFIKASENYLTSKTFVKDISICSVSQGLVSFSFLSSFFWTSCIAFHIHHQFHSIRTNLVVNVFSYLICWGLSLFLGFGIIASSSAEFSSNQSDSWCNTEVYTNLSLYYIPMIVSMTIALIYTFKVKDHFIKLSKSISSSNLINIKNKVVNRLNQFVIIFFICWSASIANFLIQLFSHSSYQIYCISTKPMYTPLTKPLSSTSLFFSSTPTPPPSSNFFSFSLRSDSNHISMVMVYWIDLGWCQRTWPVPPVSNQMIGHLMGGQYIQSEDHYLKMELDGNLVYYIGGDSVANGGVVMWESGTANIKPGPYALVFDNYGDLCIVTPFNNPIWCTKSKFLNGQYVFINPQSFIPNSPRWGLFITDHQNKLIWATSGDNGANVKIDLPNSNFANSFLDSQDLNRNKLLSGQSLTSIDNQHYLTLDHFGKLLYRSNGNNQVYWKSTETDLPNDNYQLVLQSDGDACISKVSDGVNVWCMLNKVGLGGRYLHISPKNTANGGWGFFIQKSDGEVVDGKYSGGTNAPNDDSPILSFMSKKPMPGSYLDLQDGNINWLNPNYYLTNGQHFLRIGKNGRLTLTKGSPNQEPVILWEPDYTVSYFPGLYYAQMTAAGDFCLMGMDDIPYWCAGVTGGRYLTLFPAKDDGDWGIGIFNDAGKLLWGKVKQPVIQSSNIGPNYFMNSSPFNPIYNSSLSNPYFKLNYNDNEGQFSIVSNQPSLIQGITSASTNNVLFKPTYTIQGIDDGQQTPKYLIQYGTDTTTNQHGLYARGLSSSGPNYDFFNYKIATTNQNTPHTLIALKSIPEIVLIDSKQTIIWSKGLHSF